MNKKILFISFLLSFSQGNSSLLAKHFVILITSYNNAAFTQKVLDSVFCQTHDDFEVLFFDDCSSDNTLEIVEASIKKHHCAEKCTVVRNKYRTYKAANVDRAIHRCDDESIIIILDGDDFLIDKYVLEDLNKLYCTEDVWITTGNYRSIHFESNRQYGGKSRPIPHEVIARNEFRTQEGIIWHLRSFYAWLYKQLKLEDLFWDGRFFKRAGDSAKIYPMLELAGFHYRYNKRPLYLFNARDTRISHQTNHDLGRSAHYNVLKRARYSALKQPQPSRESRVITARTIALLFTQTTKKLDEYLSELIVQQEIHKIIVIAENYVQQIESYQKIKKEFPFIEFIFCNQSKNMIEKLRKAIGNTDNTFIMCLENENFFSDTCDIKRCVRMLERTRAASIFMQAPEMLVPQQGPCEYVDYNVWAWQAGFSTLDWQHTHALSNCIYRADDLLKLFSQINCQHIASIKKGLASVRYSPTTIWLFAHGDPDEKQYEIMFYNE